MLFVINLLIDRSLYQPHRSQYFYHINSTLFLFYSCSVYMLNNATMIHTRLVQGNTQRTSTCLCKISLTGQWTCTIVCTPNLCQVGFAQAIILLKNNNSVQVTQGNYHNIGVSDTCTLLLAENVFRMGLIKMV